MSGVSSGQRYSRGSTKAMLGGFGLLLRPLGDSIMRPIGKTNRKAKEVTTTSTRMTSMRASSFPQATLPAQPTCWINVVYRWLPRGFSGARHD